MIDIHCHILHGIDDGASSFSIAKQMLNAAAADGIDTIFCTPHYSGKALQEAPGLRQELVSQADEAGIRLLPGMEYAYSNFHKHQEELQPLGESSFLLIDLGCSALPSSSGELFFSLAQRGYQIVVAHPERYLKNLNCCFELSQRGVFFQLNAGSILGDYGRSCRRMAERMIRQGYCHYVASDAHGGRRGFRLSDCRRYLGSAYGTEFADLAMERNPQRLLKNLPPETLAVRRRRLFRFF